MNPSIYLKYNNSDEVQPSFNKMTFYEELYIDAKTEIIEQGQRIQIHIHPKQDVTIQELTIKLSHSFQADDEIFCNGFQSQTESLVYSPNESLPVLGGLVGSKWHQLGNYRHPLLKDLSANLHSWTYSHIRQASGQYLLIGSLAENTGFTIIKHCCNQNIIKISWEATDFKIGHSFPALDIVILKGKEEVVFNQYFGLMESKVGREILPLRSGISVDTEVEGSFLQEQVSAFGAQGIPFDLVMVQGGYPLAIGDWLTGAGNAPQGIPTAAKTIHSTSLKAGIHIAPFLCSRNSDFYKNKKECLLKDATGQVVKIKNAAAAGGYYYVLDYYNKAVSDYLSTLLTALTQQWSYDFISLDWLHIICLYPPPNKTMGQVMCEALDFLQDRCGSTPLIASSVPLGAAFGRVAYCQLAAYPIGSWKSSWLSWNRVRERGTALASIPTQLNRRHAVNRIFRQAPSLMIAGSTLSRYSINQQQTLLVVNSLSGAGFIITRDGTTEESEEHIAEFRQSVVDQMSHIKRVSKLEPQVYQITFSNNDINWITYLNLQRSKATLSHNGRRMELQSCESIYLKF
ncbi:MAG: alpha-galactosidase [Polaribacter sp.]|jgi:alpha-galactosidase